MERTDFWKEEGYEYESMGADMDRLAPEQWEKYLRDLKTAIIDNDWSELIAEIFDMVDYSTIERFPDVFIDLVKINPLEISYIPQAVLKKYPELLNSIPESAWKANIDLADIGNLPSEMARKYRDKLHNVARYTPGFSNIANLPIETVRENPWLLIEIIKSTDSQDRIDVIEKMPEEIKREYGATLERASGIFRQIDELQEVMSRANKLEREIDNSLKATLEGYGKSIKGEDEDGIR